MKNQSLEERLIVLEREKVEQTDICAQIQQNLIQKSSEYESQIQSMQQELDSRIDELDVTQKDDVEKVKSHYFELFHEKASEVNTVRTELEACEETLEAYKAKCKDLEYREQELSDLVDKIFSGASAEELPEPAFVALIGERFNLPGILNDLALLYVGGGFFAEAEEAYRKALKYALPTSDLRIATLTNLASLLLSQGQTREANRIFLEIIDEAKGKSLEPHVLHNYGSYLYQSGHKYEKGLEGAFGVWLKAVELEDFNPIELPTLFDVSALQCSSGDYQASVETLDKAITMIGKSGNGYKSERIKQIRKL